MLIYDVVNQQELLGFVREIQLEEERNKFVLQNYLPNRFGDQIEWRALTGTLQDQDAATIRAWDAESAIASRQGVKRINGELAPISRKIPLGEEERLRLQKLLTGSNTQIEQAVYNDAANMTRAVLARMEMLRGEGLFNATYTINEDGVILSVDWGRRGSHSVTAGTLWSNTASSTPIDDLRAWVNTYIATNGVAPAFILTSTDVVTYLMKNAQIRAFAATLSGTPNLVTVDVVNATLIAYGLPPLQTYDVNVRVNGSQTRVTPVNQVLLMPQAYEPLGETLFGPTAESLELVGAQQIALDDAPGLVAVVQKTFDPVQTWTKAVAVGLPIFPNPDLTFRAIVA